MKISIGSIKKMLIFLSYYVTDFTEGKTGIEIMTQVSFYKDAIQLHSVRDVKTPSEGGALPLAAIEAATKQLSTKNGLDIQGGDFKAGRDWDMVEVNGRRYSADAYQKALLAAAKHDVSSPHHAEAQRLDSRPRAFTAPKTTPDWDIL